MSNVQPTTPPHSDSPIRSPKQLAVVVIFAFLVPIIVILLLVDVVTTADRDGAGADSLSEASIAARLRPVAGFELRDANAPRVLQNGEAVFKAVCATCHAAGVAGAPKVGDAGAWAPRIKEGFPAMLEIALKGKGAMPPKGGNPDLDDLEVARAVAYMANQSGGQFPEPEAPAAQAEAKPEGGTKTEGDAAPPVGANPQPGGGRQNQ